MTDKTDLLPMPEGEAFGVIQAWSRNQMRDYARANVLHHTATLQAEIKALRAEVEGWKEQHMRDSAELRRLCQHRDEYKARAQRLAEALRGWWKAHRPVGWTEEQHRSCPHVNLATDAEKALATALLRDREGGLSNDCQD